MKNTNTDIYKINRSIQENLFTQYFSSPIGFLEIKATEIGLRAANFVDSELVKENTNPITQAVHQQLKEYFAGARTDFDVNFDFEGTPFQQSVWKTLCTIPFGKTWSYMELAKKLGDPKKVRAVGLANGQNKIPILVPCHRVIGSDGTLIGYAGGLHRKKFLLELENPTRQGVLF